MSFDPLKHTNRLFSSLQGKFVKVSISQGENNFNYTGYLIAVNNFFLVLKSKRGKLLLVLKSKRGKLRFLNIQRIIRVIEVENEAK